MANLQTRLLRKRAGRARTRCDRKQQRTKAIRDGLAKQVAERTALDVALQPADRPPFTDGTPILSSWQGVPVTSSAGGQLGTSQQTIAGIIVTSTITTTQNESDPAPREPETQSAQQTSWSTSFLSQPVPSELEVPPGTRLYATLKPAQRAAFAASRHNIPHYLFRVFSEHSQKPRSPISDPSTITPRGFLFPGHISHNSINDFHGKTLKKMILDHLKTQYTLTEFTSWSHNLLFVLNYAYALKHRYNCTSVRICILGTTKLSQQAVHAARDLAVAFDEPFHCLHEYLIHGHISGKQVLSIVNFDDVLSNGLLKLLPEIRKTAKQEDFDWGHALRERLFTPPAKAPTKSELNTCSRIGQLFGSRLQVPMMCALVATRNRGWEHGIWKRSQIDGVVRHLEKWCPGGLDTVVDGAWERGLVARERTHGAGVGGEGEVGNREVRQFLSLMGMLGRSAWGRIQG